MFTAAVASTLLCSISKHKEKLLLVESFNEFDDFVSKHFSGQLNNKKIIKNIQRVFAVGWMMSVIAISLFIVSSYNTNLAMFLFGIQISIPNHIVHIEAFQLLMFVSGIQTRLKLISDELKNLRKENVSKLENLMEALIKLEETNKNFNQIFELPLLLNLMQLHGSLLINSYWLGVALFGVPYAVVSDAFTFIVPSMTILLYFAQLDRKAMKMKHKFVADLLSLNLHSSQSEECLILIHRCKFSTKAFGAFDTSFAMFGKVSYL